MSDQNLSANNNLYSLANNSKQNLSANNNNNNQNSKENIIKYQNLNLQESIKKQQSSLSFQEHEINEELEELGNKIRLEIAKREQSNLKHNILYIPAVGKSIKEKIIQDLKLLNEKTPVKNSRISLENNYGCKCEKGDGKEMPILLKSLLKNKLTIIEAIHKLTCVEDILKCKIKFRENLDSIAIDLKANHKDYNDNSILVYREQWSKVVTELNELKTIQTSLDLKINNQMLDTKISSDDYDYLKHTIELKAIKCEFLLKHIDHIKEVFREEIEVKNKFIHIMAQMLEMSNSVLHRNSLLTQQMADSYCNMIRTAQGLKMKN